MRLSKAPILLASLFVMGFGVLSEQAQASNVLLFVDVSDPAAVTFTSTLNLSSVNDSSFTTYEGVDLVGFFSSEYVGSSGLMSGNLKFPTAAWQYYKWNSDQRVPGAPWSDLNLYNHDSTPGNQAFSTTAAAFTGTGTINLTGYSLPSPGDSGDIIPGANSATPFPVIGQWQVVAVPEPSSVLLSGLGLAALLGRRYLRK